MLSNGHDDRLVIRRRVDGTQPVYPDGNTASNVRCDDPIRGWRVDALEEYKRLRVERRRLIQGR